MPVFGTQMFGSGGGGWGVEQSLFFESGDNSYMQEIQGAGTGQSFTFSFWILRRNVSTAEGWVVNGSPSGSAGYADYIRFESGDTIRYRIYSKGKDITTTATFSDVTVWYNVVANYNGSSGAVKLYVNGTEVGSSTGGSSGGSYFNDTGAGNLLDLMHSGSGGNNAYGYLAEFIKVDNQVLGPTEFGYDDGGLWTPIEYEGTYGNNGLRLTFENTSDFGEDFSGNDNDLTATNLDADDQSALVPPET